MAHENPNPATETTGYEKKDVNVKMVLLVAAVIIILIVVFIIRINSLYMLTQQEIIQTSQLKPQSAALRDLRAHEDEVLNSYKLLDASTGKYQIPIDRAMELVAAEAYRAQPNK